MPNYGASTPQTQSEEIHHMRLKKLGMIMFAVFALGAVMASSAFAAATTEAKQWKTGTTEGGVTALAEGTTQAVTLENGSTKFTFASTVGTNNVPLKLSAGSISCEGCTIENKKVGGAGSAVALGAGKIKFTSVSVVEPSTCKVKGEAITSNPLTVAAHYMEGTTAFQKFSPASGEPGFATITLEAGTGACAISGSYVVKTTTGLFSKAVNATGVYKTSQENVFTPTINTTAGGNLFLQTETHKAELAGNGIFKAGTKFFGIG